MSKQYDDELEPKYILYKARYANEDDFSRIVELDILKGVGPYENFCFFPYALNGHMPI